MFGKRSCFPSELHNPETNTMESIVLLLIAVVSVCLSKSLDDDLPLSIRKYKGKNDLHNLTSWSTPDLTDVFYSFVLSTEIMCHRRIRLGKLGDGGWDVCDDEQYRPKKKNCLIYSFGINNMWSFDDNSSQLYGCEVHSFDPSMAVKDHKRSDLITFHNMGLNGSDSKTGGPSKNWVMKSLLSIRKMLGHEKRVIDILKMDIEGSEWHMLASALKDGSLNLVGQLLMEYHSNDARWRLLRNLPSMVELYKQGFKRYHGARNQFCLIKYPVQSFPGTLAGCHEVYHINTKLYK